MGCNEAKDENLPILLCNFKTGNEDQKAYCIKLTKNFKYQKKIKYSINSAQGVPFSVKFKLNNQIHDIQNVYQCSDEDMNSALNRMYDLIDSNSKS